MTSLNPDTTLQIRPAAQRSLSVQPVSSGPVEGDVFMRVPGLAAITGDRLGLAAVTASTTPSAIRSCSITCLSVSAL